MTDETKPKSKRGAHFTPEFQRMAQSHRTHESLSYAQSCRTSQSLSEAGKKGYQKVEELYGPGFAVSMANKGGREYRKEHESWPERIMKSLLTRLKIGFRREWPIEGSDLSADFYLPKTRQVIEVNSNWHNQPDRQECDERKQALLKERGIPCLVIWERELLDPDPENACAVTERIKDFVARGREPQAKAQDQAVKQPEQPKQRRGIELSR